MSSWQTIKSTTASLCLSHLTTNQPRRRLGVRFGQLDFYQRGDLELKLLFLVMSILQPVVSWMHFACWLLVVTSLHPWSGGCRGSGFFRRSSETSYFGDDTRRTGIRGNEVNLTLQVVISSAENGQWYSMDFKAF
ncbi:hypothetical protein Rs2_20122 [Raphanus sativus]|nr:hypothetical protein Rs2_20122 [Raphanus sativus]